MGGPPPPFKGGGPFFHCTKEKGGPKRCFGVKTGSRPHFEWFLPPSRLIALDRGKKSIFNCVDPLFRGQPPYIAAILSAMIGGFGFGVIGARLYIVWFSTACAMQPANRVLYKRRQYQKVLFMATRHWKQAANVLYRPQPPLTIAGILSAMIGGFGFGVIGLRLYIYYWF